METCSTPLHGYSTLKENMMMHAMATASRTEKPGEITVSSSRFGEMSVNPEKVVTLIAPFLGFPDSHRFIVKPHGEESPFLWLQSLDDPKLAFVAIQAALLIPQYQPEISGSVRQELQASPEYPLEILLILTVPRENPEGMTANLLGPVVLNSSKRLAKQVLQDPARFDACWPVFTMDRAE